MHVRFQQFVSGRSRLCITDRQAREVLRHLIQRQRQLVRTAKKGVRGSEVDFHHAAFGPGAYAKNGAYALGVEARTSGFAKKDLKPSQSEALKGLFKSLVCLTFPKAGVHFEGGDTGKTGVGSVLGEVFLDDAIGSLRSLTTGCQGKPEDRKP